MTSKAYQRRNQNTLVRPAHFKFFCECDKQSLSRARPKYFGPSYTFINFCDCDKQSLSRTRPKYFGPSYTFLWMWQAKLIKDATKILWSVLHKNFCTKICEWSSKALTGRDRNILVRPTHTKIIFYAYVKTIASSIYVSVFFTRCTTTRKYYAIIFTQKIPM